MHCKKETKMAYDLTQVIGLGYCIWDEVIGTTYIKVYKSHPGVFWVNPFKTVTAFT